MAFNKIIGVQAQLRKKLIKFPVLQCANFLDDFVKKHVSERRIAISVH